jgi:hypothetical protein
MCDIRLYEVVRRITPLPAICTPAHADDLLEGAVQAFDVSKARQLDAKAGGMDHAVHMLRFGVY